MEWGLAGSGAGQRRQHNVGVFSLSTDVTHLLSTSIIFPHATELEFLLEVASTEFSDMTEAEKERGRGAQMATAAVS